MPLSQIITLVNVACKINFKFQSTGILSPEKRRAFSAFLNAPLCSVALVCGLLSSDRAFEKVGKMSANKRVITYALLFALYWAISQPCIGEESPLYKFVLKDISGKDVNLGQYKGKVNYININ